MSNPPNQDLLQTHLHAWALEAVASGASLLQLYTQLGDARQRLRAIQVLDAAKAWLAQYPSKVQSLPPSPAIHSGDADAELLAWRSALGASTGILLFLTLAQGPTKPVFGLRGQITRFTRASKDAMQGLQCAFPDDQALAGAQEAIAIVLDVCRQAFTQCFPEEAASGVMDTLLDSFHSALNSYLLG